MRREWALAALLAAALWSPLQAEEPGEVSFSTASLTGDYMEFRSSENVVIARGNAVAVSSGTHLRADELTVYLSSQVAVAVGRAVLLSSGTRLEADRLVLRQQTQEADAQGHIFLQDAEMTLMAEGVQYNWGRSTGIFDNVFIQQGAWRTWGRRLERLGPMVYRIRRAAFTSCDENPPHYHFRGRTAVFRVRRRMSATSLRSVAERTPFLYFPYYTRSLADNRWTFTVDPGNSARNGLFTKSVFTYPLAPSLKASVLWDYYSRAGNGLGAEVTYSTDTARGSASGYQITDRIDQRRRWNVRLGHWQKLSSRWQVQSRVALQSDQSVNDVFIQDDYQRVRQVGESDVAFTRTGRWYTARLAAQHNRSLDPGENRFVTSKTVLPQLGFQSSSLRLGKTNGYFNFRGNFRSEYNRPPDPISTGIDHIRQYADGAAGLTWRFPVTTFLSFDPSAGISETWQSHRDNGTELDPRDLTQGRGNVGVNMRHRLTPDWNYDFGHRYQVRWRPNTFHRDHHSSDHGIETNSLNLATAYNTGRTWQARASTAYDLRDTVSGEQPYYHTPRQRFSPPTLDFTYTPGRLLTVTGRESVQLYPVRKPQSSVMDVRVGRDDKTYFSSGFSYNSFRPGSLDLTHAAAFYLTRGWWLSGDVHTTATGAGRMRYHTLQFKEKNLVVRRDLHCWMVRFAYKERTGSGTTGSSSHEFYVRLDLKSNLDFRARSLAEEEKQYYPARDRRGD